MADYLNDPRFFDDQSGLDVVTVMNSNSNDTVTGVNGLPTVSTPMQTSAVTDYGTSILQLLGSASQTARDVGTAVGSIKRDLKGVPAAYQTAQDNAASGNKVGTFWQYASPTDKTMIILAVVAIAVTLYKA